MSSNKNPASDTTKENTPVTTTKSPKLTTPEITKKKSEHRPEPTIPLYIARYDKPENPNKPKHWTFFLDSPNPTFRIQHAIKGPNERTYFEYVKTVGEYPGENPDLVQMTFLCDVAASNFDAINVLAEGMPVYRYRHDWDGQVYVLDLIEALENARIIDVSGNMGALYKEYKGVIWGYLEEGTVKPLRGLWDRSLWGGGEDW